MRGVWDGSGLPLAKWVLVPGAWVVLLGLGGALRRPGRALRHHEKWSPVLKKQKKAEFSCLLFSMLCSQAPLHLSRDLWRAEEKSPALGRSTAGVILPSVQPSRRSPACLSVMLRLVSAALAPC